MASPTRVISRMMVSMFFNVAACHRSHDECQHVVSKGAVAEFSASPSYQAIAEGRRLRQEHGVRGDPRP
jgi:hypothetical protein